MTTVRFPPSKYRLAKILVLLALTISVLICVLPERKARPLVAPDGWVTTTGFFRNTQPAADEIRKSVIRSPNVVYWRSWSPETQATQGEIRSAAFTPPRFLLVPYNGFAGNPGITLNLECIGSGKQLAVATARTNNQWSEALLYVPSSWCPGQATLVGKTTSSSQYLSVGTPFSVSMLSYVKSGVLGILAPFVLAFSIIAGLMVLGGAVFLRMHACREPVTGGFLGFGGLGLGMFFLFYFSPAAGSIASGVLSVAAMLTLLHLHRLSRRPVVANDLYWSSWEAWRLPLLLWLIGASFLLFLAYAVQNGAGPWTMNARFTPVQWSTDNQIPKTVAEALYSGRDLLTLPMGSWKMSDRPPLSYGLLAFLRATSQIFVYREDGYYMADQFNQLFGLIVNTSWIPALVLAGRWLRLSRRRTITLVVLVTLTSFTIFNSIYIWPKLLGGAFGMMALLVVMERDDGLSLLRTRPSARVIAVCAALSAFALLSHGGTVFGVVAMLIGVICVRGVPRLPGLMAGALVAIGVLLPWSLWQHFVQPPGNALIKFAFAGTFGFGEDDMSVWATAARTYSKLDLSTWSHIKMTGLKTLLFGFESQCGIGEMSKSVASPLGYLRILDFMYVLPSFRFALLGLVPLAGLFVLPKVFAGTGDTLMQKRSAAYLVGIGGVAIFLDLSLTLECFIIHHQAYQAILGMYAGLFVLLLLSRHWLAKAALIASVVYAAVVWIIEPIVTSHNASAPAVCGLACVILFVCASYLHGETTDGEAR